MSYNEPHFLLNYIEPNYEFISDQDGNYRIDVSVKLGDEILPDKIRIFRQQILTQEAQKSSLFAMAFVQKLAIDGDFQALDIQAIYQAYHQYLEIGDQSILQEVCSRILQNKRVDPLALHIAQYIDLTLHSQSIPPSLSSARTLINQLIPGLEEALTIQLPQKIYVEQEIIIPEFVGQYHAFPDIVYHQNQYFVCFREGNVHAGHEDFGRIRVLQGHFNEESKSWVWESKALLSSPDYDLRDPKFFIKTDQSLHMIVGGSKFNDNDETIAMVPHVASLKGSQWRLQEATVDISANGERGQWIWRVTWNPQDNCGYALSYGQEGHVNVMKTHNGLSFQKISAISCEELIDFTEGTIRFRSDGTAVALIRTRRNGLIATSTLANGSINWNLSIVPFRVGGPNFIFSQTEQKMWAATRHFFLNSDNTLDEATIIAAMDENTLMPVLRLKSQGDNSYPGLCLEKDGTATVVYYSSPSKTQSRIYITRFTLPK